MQDDTVFSWLLIIFMLWLGCGALQCAKQGVNECLFGAREPELNDRPLIGILTQPGSPAPPNHTYIAASYVKYVEAAGAQAVPIQCDLPRREIRRRFEKINGILIPGGGQNLTAGHPYYDAAQQLLDLTISANALGETFPLHATCLGFEALAVIVSRNDSVLSLFDGLNTPLPLLLAPGGARSYFWRSLPSPVQKDLQEKPYSMENHEQGLSLAAFGRNRRLRDFFKVISTSRDRQDSVFISTMEANKYPVTATQWHPEKNAFEWSRRLDIPHAPGAVDVTLAVAKVLVGGARLNFHAPANDLEEDELLIYNWNTTFTGKSMPSGKGEGSDFLECYFFPPEPQRQALAFENSVTDLPDIKPIRDRPGYVP